jgi:hypothetical protein
MAAEKLATAEDRFARAIEIENMKPRLVALALKESSKNLVRRSVRDIALYLKQQGDTSRNAVELQLMRLRNDVPRYSQLQ